MARTQSQIKAEITTAIMANPILAALYGFTVGDSYSATFSLVSLENILFESIALAIFFHEQFFDQHKAEVDAALKNQKAGTLPWYRTMALAFLFGFDLVTDTDYFDTTGATAEQISAAQIVKYAAVNESDDASRVILKIAGESAGLLAPITGEQKEAFDEYIKEIKWAGVKVTVINYQPDRLYLDLKIKYDPLVLTAEGISILNGNAPVDDALAEFMKELPFNGELKLSSLIDKLQVTEGVLDATLINAKSSWIDAEEGDYGNPVDIDIAVIPTSGYFTIYSNNITYYA